MAVFVPSFLEENGNSHPLYWRLPHLRHTGKGLQIGMGEEQSRGKLVHVSWIICKINIGHAIADFPQEPLPLHEALRCTSAA